MLISTHLSSNDIENIINLIQEQIPFVQAIYIFGSHANGESTELSDVDVAFLAETSQNTEKIFELSLYLSSKIKKDIDCIDLKSTNTVLAMQIISTGKIIYCADQNKVDFFEVTIFSMYANLNEERKEIIEDVLKRGSIYGK